MSALPGDPASNAFVFPPFVPPAPRPAQPAAEAAPAQPAVEDFAMEVPLPAHDLGDPDTDLPSHGRDGNEADAQPWEASAPPAADDFPWLEMPAEGPRVHAADPAPDAIPDWAPWDSSTAEETPAAAEQRPDSAYDYSAQEDAEVMPQAVETPAPFVEPVSDVMFTPDPDATRASDYDASHRVADVGADEAALSSESALGFDSSEPTAAFQSSEHGSDFQATEHASGFESAEETPSFQSPAPAWDAQASEPISDSEVSESSSDYNSTRPRSEFQSTQADSGDDEPVTDFGGVPAMSEFGAVDPTFGYGATEPAAEFGAAELAARFGDDTAPVSDLASADEDFGPTTRFDDARSADPTAPAFTIEDALSEADSRSGDASADADAGELPTFDSSAMAYAAGTQGFDQAEEGEAERPAFDASTAPADELPAFYAASVPTAQPDGYGEVADRLESIARSLRDDPAAFLAGGSGDALGLLVTGFVLGYGHGRREG